MYIGCCFALVWQSIRIVKSGGGSEREWRYQWHSKVRYVITINCKLQFHRWINYYYVTRCSLMTVQRTCYLIIYINTINKILVSLNEVYTSIATFPTPACRSKGLNSKSLVRSAQWQELLNFLYLGNIDLTRGKWRASERHNFANGGANSGASITLVPGTSAPLGMLVNFVADKATARFVPLPTRALAPARVIRVHRMIKASNRLYESCYY